MLYGTLALCLLSQTVLASEAEETNATNVLEPTVEYFNRRVLQSTSGRPGDHTIRRTGYNFVCRPHESPTESGTMWTRMVYPTEFERGPFPIVTWGHGIGNGVAWGLLEDIASLGVVVLAVDGWCDDLWKDMLK